MADKTSIEWTDATWNPIRGCTRVSEGCRNCYAEQVAARFSDPGQAYHGLATRNPARWTGEVWLVEDALRQPLKWKRPRKIFVNSMSDLFHEKLDFEDIDRAFGVMAIASQHTFQILTKRAGRMLNYMPMPGRNCRVADAAASIASGGNKTADRAYVEIGHGETLAKWPLPNVWLGVSVEDQAAADERIPLLLQTPAAKRFLSCEPLLGPIDLKGSCRAGWDGDIRRAKPAASIDWVIAGGESGHGARPMHPDWARSLRDQCAAARTPFFFKQWGEFALGALSENWTAVANDENLKFNDPLLDVQQVTRVGKKRAGRMLDGCEHNEFPK